MLVVHEEIINRFAFYFIKLSSFRFSPKSVM